MNYYKKYQKYKNKYINLKNQLGGLILGEGSFGTVITNPRLPMFNEVFSDLFNFENNIYISKNEVSKIFKNNEEYEEEITKINMLISTNPSCFIDKYFVMPLKYGNINYQEIINYEEFFNDSSYLINSETMQIVYKKENPVIVNGIYTHSLNYKVFLTALQNILNCINKLQEHKLFFDDLKFDNVVYDETQTFKFIDFSSIIDLKNENINTVLQNSVICKLSNLYSITNNPIISALLRARVFLTDAERLLLKTKIYYEYKDNITALLYNFTPKIKEKQVTVNVLVGDNFENKIVKFGDILSIYQIIYNPSYPNRNIILKNILDKLKERSFYDLLEKNHMYSLTNLFLEFIYHCRCEIVDSLINLIVSASSILVIDDEIYITSNNINTIISSIKTIDIVELEKIQNHDLIVFDSLPEPKPIIAPVKLKLPPINK